MPDVKFSNLYPYTDFHELNLDWVIKEVKYWSTKVGKTIQSIELTGTVGLVDTYTINYSDGTTSTFDVTNGNGIASVAKTGTAGLVDTYTITFQDGSTSTFTVTNGAEGVVQTTGSSSTYVMSQAAVTDELTDLKNDVGNYDIGTTYNTLDASFNRVMAVYPIDDVDATFIYRITNKSTNGAISIRITDAISPYNAALLETVATLNAPDTAQSGTFTISAANKPNAKYIIILCATANLVVSFDVYLTVDRSLGDIILTDDNRIAAMEQLSDEIFAGYVQGGVNGSTGADAASNGTVRSDYFNIDVIKNVFLADSTGLHVQLYSYDNMLTFLGRNDLGVVAFDYDSVKIGSYRAGAKFVRFAIYLDGGGNFSPADLATNGGFEIITSYLSAVKIMNDNTATDFRKICQTVGRTPMATWVDDDGIISNSGQDIPGVVVPVAEALSIPVTFAVITPFSGSTVVDGQTLTAEQYFQYLQTKGHHITSHPVHTHWYGAGYDLSKVEPELIDNLVTLAAAHLFHSDMLVYPGSSSSNAAIVEIVRKWCVCGVTSGYNAPNHLGINTKWQIKRTFVNFADYYTNHGSDPGFVSSMQYYKDQVDAAAAAGDWIVFGTHSYQFTVSSDTTDPNANTTGNLQSLMNYALTKGLEFRTLWDAYNRRHNMFDFEEINK